MTSRGRDDPRSAAGEACSTAATFPGRPIQADRTHNPGRHRRSETTFAGTLFTPSFCHDVKSPSTPTPSVIESPNAIAQFGSRRRGASERHVESEPRKAKMRYRRFPAPSGSSRTRKNDFHSMRRRGFKPARHGKRVRTICLHERYHFEGLSSTENSITGIEAAGQPRLIEPSTTSPTDVLARNAAFKYAPGMAEVTGGSCPFPIASRRKAPG